MVSTIQALPTEVVHLIAAGEVIDSLASVVRELAENSIDAGATRIVVAMWPEQWRVRVTDNGCGMNLEDLQRAASAHSTSKIRICADLWKITSLGFRGEALHSLTTLADLEILSRPAPSVEGGVCGWRVVYGYTGEVVHLEAAAIAPGTVVTVSNLFGNCLGRRQGLPSTAQQMRAVQTTIQQIALCHPHIAWQVWQNDREWFTISPASTMGQLIPQILHQVRASDLQELQVEIPEKESQANDSKLNLVIGLPDRASRHRPDWLRVAVNGRMVKTSELEQTILGAFHRTLPRDRYPICCLHLLIHPGHINWNRNPAKTEIYLNDVNYWQQQISQAIEQALRINSATVKEVVHTSRVGKLIKAAEEKSNYNINPSQPDEPNQTSHYLTAVGQVNNTYIVAEHPGGLWLVEQHIAHERVLYEQLCDHWQIVPVEPPIILYQLSPAQVSQLQRIGLDIEPFGEQLWAVRSLPALLQQRDDCADAILELSWGGDLQTAQVAVACRSAIRNGTPLSLPEMQTLLNDWQRTRNPRTCPHGRPIYLSLEESALARFFRRHWVIGKSHGI
ncbi:DNA mismatch repair endonuclease MutL [Chlorogloeopsis fritschii PCC 9212]|uniref:DNA mismatch repair protein MutL n=1 Tax=Chlorogloeopsis fritschii PCC 6912 TaxID=211165 RepID=A0A433N4J3_CHLFR|nr:DNA mismatch repair endonuclease MutL [Chlorogloeopsis fritschii]RUR76255.1 DNA mismatch repair protein MutL [Chlorogloeopsis fritschii PCC 6912]